MPASSALDFGQQKSIIMICGRCAQIKMCILNRIKRIQNAIPTFCSALLLSHNNDQSTIHTHLINNCNQFSVPSLMSRFLATCCTFFSIEVHTLLVWALDDLDTIQTRPKKRDGQLFEACVLRAMLSNNNHKQSNTPLVNAHVSILFGSHSLDQLMLLHLVLSYSSLYVCVSVYVCGRAIRYISINTFTYYPFWLCMCCFFKYYSNAIHKSLQ